MGVFGSLPLLAVAVLAPVYLIAGLLALYLVLPPRTFRSPQYRNRRPAENRSKFAWSTLAPIAILAGAAVGSVVVWYVGDVANVFGVSPTWVDRIWVGAVVAGAFVAFLNVWRGRWWRRAIAVVSVAVFVLAGALAVNRDASAYQTLAEAIGRSSVRALRLPTPTDTSPGPGSSRAPHVPFYAQSTVFDAQLYKAWQAPAGMPRTGRVGTIDIPGVVSHFDARPAIVYLPPAALVKDPPALPVVIMLSGQPGDPNSLLISGHLTTTLDKLARENHGLAPIVVIPDQLGSTYANPMCVDGDLGNSATYLTTDVPAFITRHFRVARGTQAWAIGGFSEGGTCAIQLGAAHADLFGSFIDVSGELGPTLASRAATIRDGFEGSAVRYQRAQPSSILAAHAPYPNFVAFFAVGQTDHSYRDAMVDNSEAAQAAGMHVIRDVIPHSGHDWSTATVGMADGLAYLYPRLGLASPSQ